MKNFQYALNVEGINLYKDYMNIFILDYDPIKAAQMQCDKHVVKMCLETAQLLCSIYPNGQAPYKRTHYNHPCSKWARESWANYYWLYKHGIALCNEYTFRYRKTHKCLDIMIWCWSNIDFKLLDRVDEYEPIAFPKCMPDDCKVNDVVQSYRNYYIKHKGHIATWTKRNVPDWFKIKEDINEAF